MTRQKLLTTGAGSLLTAGLLTTAALAMPAAASAAPGTTFRAAAINDDDQKTLRELYQAALAHKAVDELVTEKADAGTLSGTLAHAQHFTANSAALQTKIESLAFNEGVTLPTSVQAKDRTALNKASKATGRNFDKAVFSFQVSVVAREIKANSVALKSKNDAVSGFAKDAKPQYDRFFIDLRGLSEEVGVKRPSLINTGTGGPQRELPAGVGIVLVLAGAGVAGGSLLTARRASR